MTSSVIRCVLDTAAEVFKEPIRAEDNLFDLGVDSFLVITLCQRLEERLGVAVDLQTLLQADSLGAFAAGLPTVSDGRL